jgi:hypothetical protein
MRVIWRRQTETMQPSHQMSPDVYPVTLQRGSDPHDHQQAVDLLRCSLPGACTHLIHPRLPSAGIQRLALVHIRGLCSTLSLRVSAAPGAFWLGDTASSDACDHMPASDVGAEHMAHPAARRWQLCAITEHSRTPCAGRVLHLPNAAG